tara:strand:+ start:169 stop:603 length:435 start_codon:yes stop_codon:yes gene_type:complete
MLKAAAEGLGEGSGEQAGILGVSVLTSLDETSLGKIGVMATPGKLVSKMAKIIDAAGCEGIVSSAQELGVVAEVAPQLLKVIPGIRPGGTDSSEQARTTTPEKAIAHGADWLVIGRPIIAANNPEEAAASIANAVGSSADIAED